MKTIYLDPASIHADFHKRGLVPDGATCYLPSSCRDAYAFIQWVHEGVGEGDEVLLGNTTYHDYHGWSVGLRQWYPRRMFTACPKCKYLTAPDGQPFHANNCPETAP